MDLPCLQKVRKFLKKATLKCKICLVLPSDSKRCTWLLVMVQSLPILHLLDMWSKAIVVSFSCLLKQPPVHILDSPTHFLRLFKASDPEEGQWENGGKMGFAYGGKADLLMST